MVGCMVGTSLAMAPAVLLAQDADFVDLDGPLLLARDRSPALTYRGLAGLTARAGALGLRQPKARSARVPSAATPTMAKKPVDPKLFVERP